MTSSEGASITVSCRMSRSWSSSAHSTTARSVESRAMPSSNSWCGVTASCIRPPAAASAAAAVRRSTAATTAGCSGG